MQKYDGAKLAGRLTGGGLVLCLATLLGAAGGSPSSTTFSGRRAFENLKWIVALGPRPSGSAALAKTRVEIQRQLKQAGLTVEEDAFTASTPLGQVAMTNLIAPIPGEQRKIVILAGHYETKRFDDIHFLGANDGGSSTAILLEMGRVLAKRKNKFTYWLVFFDGEEAFVQFSATDGLYGSRHLVQKLAARGELNRIQAMIVLDMVADAKLNIYRDYNSTAWLAEKVFAVARRLGYGRYFRDEPRAYEDDHIPFVKAGVSAVDLLDFDYGPNNRYWHSAQDTLDKCSPTSLAIVGRVVLATLEELEKSERLP